jgi:cell division transport system permease protein
VANIHIKTAWNHIRRSPFQALAAIFVLTLTFFITTMLSVLVYSSNRVLTYFETRPQVIAFIKDETSEEQIKELQTQLVRDERVEEVTYVTKEQALEIYKEATVENPLLSELVSPSIFPASLEFTLKDLSYAEDIVGELKNQEIIDEVGFTASLGGESSLSDAINRLRNISYYIKVGGGVLTGFLVFASYLVLVVIIGMRITTRRDEIEILDLIGATPGFIRSPILLEAVMYAIFAVIMGWVLSLMLVLYATPSVIAYFGEIPVLPRDTVSVMKIFGIILAAEFLVGLFLAVTGSMIAVSRVKR